LVQKICEVCKESSRITDEEAANIEVVSPSVASKLRVATGQQNLSGARVFRGRGCGACGNKGYAGRIGIFELLEITDDMRVLLTKKPTALEIQQLAEKEGMAPLLDDAVNKIMQGNTTVQEVLRAVNI
jgi:type IV pilus assembly protein PilB